MLSPIQKAAMAQSWHVYPGHSLGAAQLKGMPYSVLTSDEEGPLAIVFEKQVTTAHMIALWCANDDSLSAKAAVGMWAGFLGMDIVDIKHHPDQLVNYLQLVRQSAPEEAQQIKASIKAQRRLARQWVTQVAMAALEAGLLQSALAE